VNFSGNNRKRRWKWNWNKKCKRGSEDDVPAGSSSVF
jgi:hypothetical protein